MKPLSALLAILLLTPPVQAEHLFNLEWGQRLTKAAFECAQAKKISISVAIVNAEGNLMLFERGDQAYVGSIEAAISKAKSANAFRRPTSAFAKAVKEGRPELLSIAAIIAVEGGVPILLKGQHVGALGISGGRAIEDEECANQALAKLLPPQS